MKRTFRIPRSVVLAPVPALALALGLVAAPACDSDKDQAPPPEAGEGNLAGGLTPELAARPLATVGDRTITLGDYANTLERMDQFERLRYQTPERRQYLLDELIKLELLAFEARSRGLDETPETRERIRIVLRDEVLRDLRKGLPAPQDISAADVRKYYDEHPSEFNDPERRRVARIVVGNEATAKQVLAKALNASPMEWGKLVHKYSAEKLPKPSPTSPLELSGDLGVVSAPSAETGGNARVPESVRKAIFTVEKVGSVYPKVIKDGDQYWVVRLTGRTPARSRSLEEADRSIRVALLREMIKEREANLEEQLRKKFPITIDDKALSQVEVPPLEPRAPEPAPKKK